MRTHEEYKTEVIRRAEQCKRARKRNCRCIMVCMCFLLVCGMGYMVVPHVDVYDLCAYQTEWPDLYEWLTSPSKTYGETNGSGGLQASAGNLTPHVSNPWENQKLEIVCVKICDADDGVETVTLTKAHEIKRLCEFLQTAIAECPTDGEVLEGGSHIICFCTEDGEAYRLFLQGNRLSGNGQDDSVCLSKRMLKAFKQMIGE